MAKGTCTVNGCDQPRRGNHGLCNKHRLRLQRRGLLHLLVTYAPAEQRFWTSVKKLDNSCWEWRAGRSSAGYGSFWPEGRTGTRIGAHRYSWELANGPIPAGLWVLHRCDNPSCVRPEHLFLGTVRDNSSDCAAKGRQANQRKTHCLRGHPYSGSNLYIVPKTGTGSAVNATVKRNYTAIGAERKRESGGIKSKIERQE